MLGDNQQVESIFFAALQKQSPDERAAFLTEACAGNPALHRRVKKLLHAHQRVGRFLEIEAPATVPGIDTTVVAEAPGTVIGRYKLLEPIGEGGFGVVFMAEQSEPVRRKVALKIVKPGMDSKQVIARFEAERQALAMMDHPHIARVLDAGATESGRPFFVMELVRGIPITEYCDKNRLASRQRLELFHSVCLAIQHAHQKGIIHRDIKPLNVLVTLHDGRPVVKVIDFGIAKALGERLTEKTLFTNFALMIGTPLYMSPEQAEMSGLDVDTRSDIYSLGVLLYELLTGTTPFEKERLQQAAFDEMIRIIREEDPPRPSARLSTLRQAGATVSAPQGRDARRQSQRFRGELDWIVMKSLEKDRSRRYETASAFAADIQRYLQDEPVEACPPSRIYRLRKFIRRHRTAMFATAAVGGALVLGTAMSVWQMLEAQAARREADSLLVLATQRLANEAAARRDAESERQRAERNLDTAHRAVEHYLTSVSENRLMEIPGFEPLRQELLESALSYYRIFLQEQGRDPVSRAEFAAASIRVGRIQMAMDEPEQALVSLAAGLDMIEHLGNERRTPREVLRRLAGVQSADQSQFHSTRPPPDVMRLFRTIDRGIAIWERLVRDDPDQVGFRCDLAVMYGELAEVQAGIGNRKAATQSLRRSQELWRQLVHEDTNTPRYRVGLAGCCDRLGLMLNSTGTPGEVRTAYQEQLELARILVNERPDVISYQVLLAQSQTSLGKSLVGSDPAAGEELLRQAVENYRRISAANPTVPGYREKAAISAFDLAIQLSENGRPVEAEASLREAVKLLARIVEDFPQQSDHWRRLARYHYSLGLIQYHAGSIAGATESFTKALTIREQLASQHPQIAKYLEELAWQLASCPHEELRNPVRAVILAKRAIELSPKNGNCWKTLGVAQYRVGEYDGALVSLNRSLEHSISSRAPHWFLAMTHWQRDEKEQARACFELARRWMDENRPNNLELRNFRRELERLFDGPAP